MPTKRPRYTITETDELAEALARVRRVHSDESRSATEIIGELILRGADSVVADEERRTNARERLIAELRDLEPDQDAAADVRVRGWIRE